MQGGTVAGFLTVTELPALGGRIKLHKYHCHSLITEIDGELRVGVRYCVDAAIFDEDTDELMLIMRLSNPVGLAMVGGGIEVGESPLQTLLREGGEETGCLIDPLKAAPVGVLVGADRDPRGDQVSIVYRVQAKTAGAKGESGKTRIERMLNSSGNLPDVQAFAFSDHHQAVATMLAA